MNYKRYFISAIICFIAIFVFEFIVHAILLEDLYTQTSQIWRSKEESKMIFMFASQLTFSFVLAFIFTRNFEGKGLAEGLRFGLYVGLLLASIEIGAYCYLPVPFILVAAWMIAATFKGVLCGAVLGLSYKD